MSGISTLSDEAIYFILNKLYEKKEYQKCLDILNEHESRLKGDGEFANRKELYTMAVEKKYPFNLEDEENGS